MCCVLFRSMWYGEVVGDLWWGCCMRSWCGGDIGICDGGGMVLCVCVATKSMTSIMVIV